MIKTTLSGGALAAVMIFAAACSKSSAPGQWVTLDAKSGDAFFNVNFVNESVGWVNGITDRSYIPSDDNANTNANKNTKPQPKPNPSAKKPEDPLKANQGF